MDVSFELPHHKRKNKIAIDPITKEIVLPEQLAIRTEQFQFALDYLSTQSPKIQAMGLNLDTMPIAKKKALFQDLQKVDDKINKPFGEYFAKGDEGISELRKELKLPRNIPLGQVISLAESVIADKDEVIRETYDDMFQTGLISSKIKQKMRVDHQMYPRDIDFLIHNQSPEQNRSIVEVVSNAIDFSKNGHDVEVVTRSDGFSVRDYGQGMTPTEIIEKLVIPFVSGTRSFDKARIGKFGMGFLTILDHLKVNGDKVSVKTAKNGIGYQFDYVYKDGDIFVNLSTQSDVKEGTDVSLSCSEFIKDDAGKLLQNHIQFKRGSKVTLNGQIINNIEDYSKLESQKSPLETSAILYKENTDTKTNNKCHLNLLINGVTIEDIELLGVNLPSEFVIDLPYTTALPESRNEVSFDTTVYETLSSLIGQVKTSSLTTEKKIQMINGLATTVQIFSSRIEADTQMIDSLLGKLSQVVIDIKTQTQTTILPAIKGIENVNQKKALYVSDILDGISLTEIPGVERISDFKSDKYVLLVADFKEDPTTPLIHKGNIVVLDRKAYEKHKNMPALLELYLELEIEKGVGIFNEKSKAHQNAENPMYYSIKFPELQKLFLREYLFTPRVIGHKLLTSFLIPGYSTDRYPMRDEEKIELSHEQAMMIYDFLAGKRKDIALDELGLGKSKAGSDLHAKDYTSLHLHHMLEGGLHDKRDAEIFQVFQAENMEQILSLPYDQVEKAFTQLIVKQLGHNAEIEALLKSGKYEKDSLAILKEMVRRNGREAQQERRSQNSSPKLDIFMRILENAIPSIENYVGYMKAYEEVKTTSIPPYFDKFLELNWNSNRVGILDGDAYYSTKGIAEMIRRFDDPKKILEDVVTPLFENPFVSREQVFSLLLASADLEAVAIKGYSMTAYPDRLWSNIAFGGPRREEMRGWETDLEYKNILKTSATRQKIISESLPKIANNIMNIGNLSFVKQMSKERSGEFEQILSQGNYSKKYFELLNTETLVKEPERFQDQLTQSQLQIIEETLNLNFKVDSMSKNDCEKALVFLNRAIGLAHLDNDKFKFSTELMMYEFKSQHRGIGNFGDFTFSDQVIDVLYSRRDCFRNKSIHEFLTVWEGLNEDKYGFVDNKPVDEIQMLKLNRILDIWDKVAKKPKFFQDMLVNEFSSQMPKGKYENYYYFKYSDTPLSEVPGLIRPYIIYFHKGDEAQLKVYEGDRLGNLPHSLNLSELSLTKRLQNEDFYEQLLKPNDFAEWVNKSSSSKDTYVAKRELMHAVHHLPTSDPYLFLRELIQNSLDISVSQKGQPTKLNIEIKDYREGNNYVVEITDQVGTTFDTVLSDMLIAGESTKSEGNLGKFGIGFLSILNGAEVVEIVTGNGIQTTSVKITPIKNDVGEIIDYRTEFAVSESQYKGTTIRKYSQDSKEILESALLHDSVLRYGSFIDENKVGVLFRGEKVNTPKKILVQKNVPGLGNIELVEGNEKALLQGDLYVTELPEYIKEMIPEPIRELALKHGIILNLDPSIPLIRSRNDIAQKNKYLPLLADALPPLLIESLLVKYSTGHFDLTSIPYDYFWADGYPRQIDRKISDETRKDADLINNNQPISDYRRYHNKEAFLELLTVVNSVTIDNKKVSLRDIAIMLDDGYDFNKTEIPKGIKKLIEDAKNRKKTVEEQKQRFDEQDKKPVEAFIPTPSQQEIMKNLSDSHLAFLDLANLHTYPEIAQKIRHGFYYLPNGTAAFVLPKSDFKSWNLLHLDYQLETLSALLQGQGSEKSKSFWKSFFETNSHEDAHLTIGTEHWGGHHNDVFYDEQKKLINYLIYHMDIDSSIDTLRQKYLGTLLPSDRLLDKIGVQNVS